MAQKFLTNIDLNKNELQNAKIQNLGTAPSDPADGQVYFDTVDNALKIYDGSGWVNLHEGDISAITVSAPITGGGTSGSVNIGLATSGVTAQSYGSATEIPTFTVDAYGRLTAASTASISTNLSFTDDLSTAASVALNGGTLSILGGTGVSTVANDSSDSVTVTIGQDVAISADVTFNTVTADLTGDVTGNVTGNLTGNVTGNVTGDVTGDLTGDVTGNLTGNVTGNVTGDVTGDLTGNVTGNVTGDLTGNVTGNVTGNLTAGNIQVGVTSSDEIDTSSGNLVIDSAGGTVTIDDHLIVSGDLTVNGDTTTVSTSTLSVEDPLIILASGNTANSVDIGFYGTYNDGTASFAGMFRDSTDGKFRLFHDLEDAPTTTVNVAGTNYTVATLVASLEGSVTGNVTGDVTGDLTGNVTGNVTGDVTGDLTGNVTGDVTGDLTGNVTGNVTGDLTGDVTGNLTGNVTGDVTGDLTGSVLTASQTNITGLGTITTGTWEATDVAVLHGGTGASTAAGAKTNLGFMTRYSALVPQSGTDTSIQMTHGLGTLFVVVEVYEVSSGETVVCDVTRDDANNVTLGFASAPADEAYRIVVIG
jgi:hypothetical protein